VRPLDEEGILESIRRTSRVLIVHEDNKALGVGAEVAAMVAEGAFDYLDAPVTRLAGPEVPAMPFAPTLEDVFMPSPEKIAAALRQLVAY
jgi:2-oxoisovalerate dehydrogenase E1 component beta subunit